MNIYFKNVSVVTALVIVMHKLFMERNQVFSPLKVMYGQLIRHRSSIPVIGILVYEIEIFFVWVIIFHVSVVD